MGTTVAKQFWHPVFNAPGDSSTSPVLAFLFKDKQLSIHNSVSIRVVFMVIDFTRSDNDHDSDDYKTLLSCCP